MATAITRDPAIPASARLSHIPPVGAFGRIVRPPALTAAGMIGAGAVATRLLADAWFGFELLRVSLYVVPIRGLFQ